MVFLQSLDGTQNEKDLFTEVYLGYRQKMFRYAMALLRDEGDAEDVVQEVFFAVAKAGAGRLPDLEREGRLWLYLSVAVRNRSLTLLKKRGAELVGEQTVYEYLDRQNAGDSTEQTAGYRFLVEAIRAMPPEYADALYCALVLELPAAETAALLGLKPATVRKRVSRGREILRKKLGEDRFG